MTAVKYCPYCEAEIPAKESFCPNCRRPTERSREVLIISVLSMLGGVIFMLGGAVTLAEAVIAGGMFKKMFSSQFLFSFMTMIIIGILLLVVGMGLWKLTLWGWWLAVIGLIIGVGSSIYGLGNKSQEIGSTVSSIVISLIIVGYLVKKRKYFFSRNS